MSQTGIIAWSTTAATNASADATVRVDQNLSTVEIGGASDAAGSQNMNGDLVEYAILPYRLNDEERESLLRQPATVWTT